jgi:hypothetical protein
MPTELGSFTAGQVLTATDLNDIATWTSYTPAFAGGVTVGNGTWSAAYAIVNKILFFQGTFTLGTTSAITGAVTLTLPDSRTFPSANEEILGNARFSVASTPFDFYGGVGESSTTAVRIFVYETAGTYLDRVNLSATVPQTWQSTNTMSISYCARID